MARDEQLSLFEEGGMIDEGGTVDPVSGNDVPTGSLQEEVRDDIPAQLSEGEFVVPADVVRYHGLDKMMALRDEAKLGLAKMEAMGQMGNSEEAMLPDDVPFGLEDLELEEAPLQFAEGGAVTNSNEPREVSFEDMMRDVSGPTETREYRNNAGDVLFIPFRNGVPLYPIPEGYFEYIPEEDADADADAEEPVVAAVATAETDSYTSIERDRKMSEGIDRQEQRIRTNTELLGIEGRRKRNGDEPEDREEVSEEVLAERERLSEVIGVPITGLIGNQPGDFDPRTGGFFGPHGVALDNEGFAIDYVSEFGLPEGVRSFATGKAAVSFANASLPRGLFGGLGYKDTLPSMQEYTAMSPEQRERAVQFLRDYEEQSGIKFEEGTPYYLMMNPDAAGLTQEEINQMDQALTPGAAAVLSGTTVTGADATGTGARTATTPATTDVIPLGRPDSFAERQTLAGTIPGGVEPPDPTAPPGTYDYDARLLERRALDVPIVPARPKDPDFFQSGNFKRQRRAEQAAWDATYGDRYNPDGSLTTIPTFGQQVEQRRLVEQYPGREERSFLGTPGPRPKPLTRGEMYFGNEEEFAGSTIRGGFSTLQEFRDQRQKEIDTWDFLYGNTHNPDGSLKTIPVLRQQEDLATLYRGVGVPSGAATAEVQPTTATYTPGAFQPRVAAAGQAPLVDPQSGMLDNERAAIRQAQQQRLVEQYPGREEGRFLGTTAQAQADLRNLMPTATAQAVEALQGSQEQQLGIPSDSERLLQANAVNNLFNKAQEAGIPISDKDRLELQFRPIEDLEKITAQFQSLIDSRPQVQPAAGQAQLVDPQSDMLRNEQAFQNFQAEERKRREAQEKAMLAQASQSGYGPPSFSSPVTVPQVTTPTPVVAAAGQAPAVDPQFGLLPNEQAYNLGALRTQFAENIANQYAQQQAQQAVAQYPGREEQPFNIAPTAYPLEDRLAQRGAMQPVTIPQVTPISDSLISNEQLAADLAKDQALLQEFRSFKSAGAETIPAPTAYPLEDRLMRRGAMQTVTPPTLPSMKGTAEQTLQTTMDSYGDPEAELNRVLASRQILPPTGVARLQDPQRDMLPNERAFQAQERARRQAQEKAMLAQASQPGYMPPSDRTAPSPVRGPSPLSLGTERAETQPTSYYRYNPDYGTDYKSITDFERRNRQAQLASEIAQQQAGRDVGPPQGGDPSRTPAVLAQEEADRKARLAAEQAAQARARAAAEQRAREAEERKAQEKRMLETVRDPGYRPPGPGGPGSSSNDDDDTSPKGRGKDTYCCTAAWQRNQMSITEIKELRRWHNKQSQLWRDGYDIWGKWVADNLVEKSDWSASVVRDVHRAFVKKEYTFKSIIGIIVIGPGVYAAGLYKRIRRNGRTAKTNS